MELVAEAADVELPPGSGHAYLLGEAKVVLRLREILAARGLPQDQMSPKAYWGRGRANAGHGEPARDALTRRHSGRPFTARNASQAPFLPIGIKVLHNKGEPAVAALPERSTSVASAVAAEVSAVLASTSTRTLILGSTRKDGCASTTGWRATSSPSQPGELIGTELCHPAGGARRAAAARFCRA